LRPRSALLDVERRPGSFHCPSCSATTGPPTLTAKFILPWPIPSRVSRCLLTARPFGREPTPLRFVVPSTTSPARAPYGAGCHPRPGSALRLSQPLSGFQASSGFAAMFRAATVPGILPSESSPRRERCTPLGAAASLPLSTDVPKCAARGLVTAGFPDSHAFTQSPGSPAGYGRPFSNQE